MFSLEDRLKRVESLCDVGYRTKSSFAEALLAEMANIDRRDDMVQLLATALCFLDSGPKTKKMPAGIREMSNVDWAESVTRLGTKPEKWAAQFSHGDQDAKVVADYLLSQLNELEGNDKAVGLALALEYLAPYAMLTHDIVGHNHDEILASLVRPHVRKVSAILHTMAYRGGLTSCQVLTLIAKELGEAKTMEDRLGLLVLSQMTMIVPKGDLRDLLSSFLAEGLMSKGE